MRRPQSSAVFSLVSYATKFIWILSIVMCFSYVLCLVAFTGLCYSGVCQTESSAKGAGNYFQRGCMLSLQLLHMTFKFLLPFGIVWYSFIWIVWWENMVYVFLRVQKLASCLLSKTKCCVGKRILSHIFLVLYIHTYTYIYIYIYIFSSYCIGIAALKALIEFSQLNKIGWSHLIYLASLKISKLPWSLKQKV